MSSAAALLDLLAAQGWPWRSAVEHHATLDSTNDRLKELAREGAPEGTVILADAQTGGRGRHGRTWISPPGNLYVSVLLRPAARPVPLLSLAAGVAVAEGLDRLGVSVRLKWPNDVVLEGRKLGGILAESSSSGPALDWVVLGVGINVKAPIAADLAGSATSLLDAGASALEVQDVASSVLACLSVWYHRLPVLTPAAVVDEWRRRSIPWWGEAVEAWSGATRISGRAAFVDDEGGLVLEMDDGSLTTLRSGDVRRCRPVS